MKGANTLGVAIVSNGHRVEIYEGGGSHFRWELGELHSIPSSGFEFR